MIIECTNCHSKYQYNEERFERKPSKKIKCAKCGTIFEIFNPALVPADPKPTSASAVGDSTFHKKPPPAKPPAESTTETSQPQASTGKTPAAALQMPAGKRLSLAIIDGPDAGNVFRIEKPRVTIGRSGADLNLNDTETSRQHAAVEVHDTSCTVQDLGSTNGTLVDGVKISAPTELIDKGEFVVGNSTIMLIVTEDIG